MTKEKHCDWNWVAEIVIDYFNEDENSWAIDVYPEDDNEGGMQVAWINDETGKVTPLVDNLEEGRDRLIPVISDAFPLPTKLFNSHDVLLFFRYLNAHMFNFHPDDNFYEYEPALNKDYCVVLNAMMDRCFNICEKESVDIYQLAGWIIGVSGMCNPLDRNVNMSPVKCAAKRFVAKAHKFIASMIECDHKGKDIQSANLIAEQSFIEGANWASTNGWKKISDKLPPNEGLVLVYSPAWINTFAVINGENKGRTYYEKRGITHWKIETKPED